jgi:hypothetical protein
MIHNADNKESVNYTGFGSYPGGAREVEEPMLRFIADVGQRFPRQAAVASRSRKPASVIQVAARGFPIHLRRPIQVPACDSQHELRAQVTAATGKTSGLLVTA